MQRPPRPRLRVTVHTAHALPVATPLAPTSPAPRRRPVVLLIASVGTVLAAGAAGVLGWGRLHGGDDPRRMAAAPGSPAPLEAPGDVLTTADGSVSRAGFAVALYRWAGSPQQTPTAAMFTDAPEDPEQAAAVQWLTVRGGLVGDAQLRVRPEDPLTRGELGAAMAALLPGIDLAADGGSAGRGSGEAVTIAELEAALGAAQAVVAH